MWPADLTISSLAPSQAFVRLGIKPPPNSCFEGLSFSKRRLDPAHLGGEFLSSVLYGAALSGLPEPVGLRNVFHNGNWPGI